MIDREFILGRYVMQGQYKSSTTYFQKAVAGEPSNADYYDWLGKAYGRRAEHSSVGTELPLAIKARECFEKAVALNPVKSVGLAAAVIGQSRGARVSSTSRSSRT